MKLPVCFGKLISESDQDEAEALEWWDCASDREKIAVWMAIQVTHPENPVQELVTRFAQVGMARIAILAEQRTDRADHAAMSETERMRQSLVKLKQHLEAVSGDPDAIGAMHRIVTDGLGEEPLPVSMVTGRIDTRPRCRVCGWPLAATAAEGCVDGNCCERKR